jgi:hypothetical protein
MGLSGSECRANDSDSSEIAKRTPHGRRQSAPPWCFGVWRLAQSSILKGIGIDSARNLHTCSSGINSALRLTPRPPSVSPAMAAPSVAVKSPHLLRLRFSVPQDSSSENPHHLASPACPACAVRRPLEREQPVLQPSVPVPFPPFSPPAPRPRPLPWEHMTRAPRQSQASKRLCFESFP